MKNNLVSVILATYNNSRYLEEAIRSVLNQSYSNFELIIVDDASEDNTPLILSALSSQDKRIKIIRNSKNLGLTKSLNIGLSKAEGEFIARIDSDDIWSDIKKLDRQINFLNKNTDYGLVGCWGFTIDKKGKIMAKLKYPTADQDIRKYLLIENCFIHSSVVFRSALLNSDGLYFEKYRFSQDYDLWLSIGEKSKFCNLPYLMIKYRKNPDGLSQVNYKPQINETIDIVKAHKKNYRYSSLALLLWRLRLYLPAKLREKLSELFRDLLFSFTLNQNKNY